MIIRNKIKNKLEMKIWNTISTEQLQKYQHSSQIKMKIMNILQVKKLIIKLKNRMDTTFMKFENSNTSDSHRQLLNF